MKVTLAEPKYLKESISIISDLVSEAQIKINPTCIELVAMDPANVAMVIFKLLSNSFIEYDVKTDVSIGINLNNLKQILRRAGANDMLTLELAEDNRLTVQLKGGTTRTFSLPLIELDEKEQKVPDLKFGATVKITSSLLNETIADADVVGESVTFIAEQKRFTVNSEGDLSQANIDIKEGENVKISVSGDEKIRSKYSIEYLKKMINGYKLADEVEINFSKDYPLKLEYKSVDRLLLSFILAPRVDND